MSVTLIDNRDDELACETLKADFDEVCDTFRTALLNLGFDEGEVSVASFSSCQIEVTVNSYDHQECSLGYWLDADGGQYAHIQRFENGYIFAEHDVLQPHPTKPSLFVEAIEIWGEAGHLNSETRLLPAL